MALLLASLAPAYAGLGFSCSGSYTLDSNSSPIVGAGLGCDQGDKYFSTFGYYLNSGAGPAAGDVNVSFSGTNPSGPITSTFTSDGWTVTAPTGGGVSDFVSNSVQVDQSISPGWVLTGFDLNPGNITLPATDNGDGVQIAMSFCTNSLTDCSSTDANYGQFDYVNSTGGLIEEYCYNGNPSIACTGGASTGALAVTFDPSAGVTSIFMDSFVIVNTFDSGTVTLAGFSTDFYEGPGTDVSAAPEPATFLLLAAALAGMAVFFRRSH